MSKKASKSIVLMFALVFLLSSTGLAAQQKNVLTVNPLGFIIGMFNGSYETVQNKQTSYKFGANFISYSSSEYDLTMMEVRGKMQFYQQKSAPKGVYIGPLVQASYVSEKDHIIDTVTESGMVVGAGGIGGYQWITNDGVAINLEAGGVYSVSSVSMDNGESTPSVNGFIPLIGINVGFTW